MRKARRVVLGLLMVLTLIVSACAPAPQAATGGTADSAAAGDEQVTIRWWHIWPEDEPAGANWQRLADQYMAEHPNINIEITITPNDPYKEKLATNMQAGDPP